MLCLSVDCEESERHLRAPIPINIVGPSSSSPHIVSHRRIAERAKGRIVSTVTRKGSGSVESKCQKCKHRTTQRRIGEAGKSVEIRGEEGYRRRRIGTIRLDVCDMNGYPIRGPGEARRREARRIKPKDARATDGRTLRGGRRAGGT